MLQIQHQYLWGWNAGLVEWNVTGMKRHNCLTMYSNSSEIKTGNSGLKNLENVEVCIFRGAEYDIVYFFDNFLKILIWLEVVKKCV